MIDDIGSIQVNAAIEYLEGRRGWWKIDWSSCRFYARLFSRKTHTYSNIV
jgi:hypothetical protein